MKITSNQNISPGNLMEGNINQSLSPEMNGSLLLQTPLNNVVLVDDSNMTSKGDNETPIQLLHFRDLLNRGSSSKKIVPSPTPTKGKMNIRCSPDSKDNNASTNCVTNHILSPLEDGHTDSLNGTIIRRD